MLPNLFSLQQLLIQVGFVLRILSKGCTRDGVYIEVEKNIKLKKPIVIINYYDSEASFVCHRNIINFPRPMIKDNSFNFSFSGLKTALINCVNESKYSYQDIAASYQEAIVDTLINKFEKAMNQYSANSGIICGGVAANKRLRDKLDKLDQKIIYPSMKYCTDNADMIAFLALHKVNNNKIDFDKDFSAYSRGMIV